MLKLHRKCLASKGILYDKNFDEIQWSYIQELDRIQRTNKINLGNELTKSHIQWEDNKMNVRLAAQTLSNSLANSIDFARVEGLKEFEKSEATVGYIRTVNNLFDVMNTKRNHNGGDFKELISERTVETFLDFFEFARDFLKKVQVFQKDRLIPIFSSNVFTGFFGFYHNANSFMGIYNDYIKGSEDSEFYTFDVSQDHLETYFGCIRRMNGCNDNPTIQQFEAAYLFY